MTPEQNALLDAQMRRGEEADRLLNDKLLQHVLESMERDVIQAMKALRPNNLEGRDVYWRELRAGERFRKKLLGYIATGKQAQKNLKPRKEKA